MKRNKIMVFILIVLLVWQLVSLCTVASAAELPLLPDTKYGGAYGSRYYFVSMFKVTLTRFDNGTWSPYAPNTTGHSIISPYSIDLPLRKIRAVSLRKFDQALYDSNATKWGQVFRDSRGGASWGDYDDKTATTYTVPSTVTLTGAGSSHVQFTMAITNLKTTAKVKPETTYKADGSVAAYTYYIPILITIDCTPYRLIKYFRSDGSSLSTIFPDSVTTLTPGKSYPVTPPTSSVLAYTSYKKTTNSVTPTGTAVSGIPPTLNFDGTYNIVTYYLYYVDQGTIYVRHMARVGPTGTFSLKAQQTQLLKPLPLSKTIGALTTYGKQLGSHLSYSGYSTGSFTAGKTTQTASLSRTYPKAYMTFFYEMPSVPPAPTIERTIAAQVDHTSFWENERVAYNVANGGDELGPRTSYYFWAGERFVLTADVTTPTSPVTITQVTASLGGHTMTLTKRSATTQHTTFVGELWSPDFVTLPQGATKAHFQATYSDGKIVSQDVVVTITTSVVARVGVHRVQ